MHANISMLHYCFASSSHVFQASLGVPICEATLSLSVSCSFCTQFAKKFDFLLFHSVSDKYIRLSRTVRKCIVVFNTSYSPCPVDAQLGCMVQWMTKRSTAPVSVCDIQCHQSFHTNNMLHATATQ